MKFVVPSDLSNATYKVFVNGTQVGTTANATVSSGIATTTLPYAAVASECSVRVELSFVYQSATYVRNTLIDVVTPYLELYEVKEVWPQATDAEAAEVEAVVRHVINSHTGQTFGYSVETLEVEGHGETSLRLPKRLVELTGLSTRSAVLNPLSAIIVSDGWYLKKGWSDELSAISDTSTYWSNWEPSNDVAPGDPGYEKPNHGPITKAPGVRTTPTPWKDDYPFTITGKWGYASVPEAVREAAKLLVNDYACSEIAYRDRYLESIKAADWRLQFSSRAWEYTGNVRADQLLSDYVILDWAVI